MTGYGDPVNRVTGATAQLVGRAGVLADLGALLDRVTATGSLLVGLTGPPGSGRTVLLDALAGRSPADGADGADGARAGHGAGGPDGVRVLRATGVPWESRRAYGVLTQLVRAAGGAGEGTLPADAFAAARRLVDALVDAPRGAPGGAPGSAAGGGAGRPVLVLVDDAQHADGASLRALATAVRHHPRVALLVVLAVREGSGRSPEERGVPVDETLSVPPLTSAEVGLVAAARGVLLAPSAADVLARHTQGAPGDVVDLLRTVPRRVWSVHPPVLPAPTRVRRATAERLAALADEHPSARCLVEAVAVLTALLADDATVPLQAAAATAGDCDALPALDAAERSGLVVAVDERGQVGLQVVDPMVRAAVLAEAGPLRRTALHERAATVVADPARALGHAAAATPLPDADLADRLDALARINAAQGAWAVAADLLVQASRTSADAALRDERLVRAVDALVGAGDVPAALDHLPEVESLPESPLRNAVLGYLAIIRGRPGEAESRLARAWETVDAETDPEAAATICQRLVLHHLSRCDGSALVTWADLAVGLVGPEHPTAVEASAIRGLGVAAEGDVPGALGHYRELSSRVRHGAAGQRVRMGTGWLHLATDDVDLAREELESALPVDYFGGSSRISLWAHAWLARAQFATGDWDDALHTVDVALELAQRSGMPLLVPLLRWTTTQVHALRGDWSAARRSMRAGDAGAGDYEVMRVPAALARAGLAEAQADYAGVLRALDPLTREWAHGQVSEPGFWPWPDVYANALVVEGRYDEAEAFLGPHEERARARGHRSAQARLAYARGRLLGGRGDLDAARTSFEAALDLLEPLPLRYDRARVGFAFGQTLRRAGKRREADVAISAAREEYAALGATTYVQRCDRELKAGGVHVVRGDRAFDDLTPQEEAVAALVAGGRSNKEVAAELFLSVKTVQYHLTRTYAKLGVRSRVELAALRSAAAQP